MNLSIPDAILPAVAAACRKHAVELRDTVDEMSHILASPHACVKEPECERARLACLRLEADSLLLVARLIDVQMGAVSAE